MGPGRLAIGSVSLLAALASAPAAGADARTATGGGAFSFHAVHVGRDSFPFAVWQPPGYDGSRAYPAIVFLHGSGESGADGVRPTRVGLGPALAADPAGWPFVVIFPQKPADAEEWEEREGMVLAVLDEARRRWTIDSSRVALTGLSQGGHGVWYLGARNPSRWNCLVPVSGYGRARTVASRIDGLPVWAFHGLDDDLVRPEDTRLIVAALRARRGEAGDAPAGRASVRMTLYPGVNHGSWDRAYAEPGLAGWIASRPPRSGR